MPRRKLDSVNTVEDVCGLLQNSKKIVVLTGAGMGVGRIFFHNTVKSCTIYSDAGGTLLGLYDIIAAAEVDDISEPQELCVSHPCIFPGTSRLHSTDAYECCVDLLERSFDIHIFREDPSLFYSVAPLLYRRYGRIRPSRAHHFLALLEERKSLLRNYTQNIDALEAVAGVKRVIWCHGNLAGATCSSKRCRCHYPVETILPVIRSGRIPRCTREFHRTCRRRSSIEPDSHGTSTEGTAAKRRRCVDDGREGRVMQVHVCRGVIRPNITFFHESLPVEFDKRVDKDLQEADMFLVMGSALKVKPVSQMIGKLRPDVPVVVINRERLEIRDEIDVTLLGDCDAWVRELCRRLDWLPQLEARIASDSDIPDASCEEEEDHDEGMNACDEEATEEDDADGPEATVPAASAASSARPATRAATGHLKWRKRSWVPRDPDHRMKRLRRSLEKQLGKGLPPPVLPRRSPPDERSHVEEVRTGVHRLVTRE